MLGPDDVGARVVVRYRLPEPDPSGATLTDVLGTLLGLGPEGLTVQRADGEVVAVPGDRVRAARRVPDPPPTRGC